MQRRDIRILSEWESIGHRKGLDKFIASGYLKNFTIFSPDCVAVELQRKRICLEKPVQLGFTILEISKIKLYDFFYNFIKKKYAENVTACYFDTDAMLLHIRTEDLYKDMLPYISNKIKIFDTSNYEKQNPYSYELVNKQEMGKCGIKIINTS